MTLAGTLEATADTESVSLSFCVENTGSEPVDLTFPDSCRADFVVYEDGTERWRYTDGRAFAQVLGTETIAPGEQTTYTETWTDPVPGTYSATAILQAQSTECTATTTFSVPNE